MKKSGVSFEITDSDIIIEELMLIKDGYFLKVENQLINLIEYFIYNKNKVVKVNSGEKINLTSSLSVNGTIDDPD